MKINLSKKKKIIAIAIITIVLGGSGGYLLWRVNQDTQLSVGDTDASNCSVVCDRDSSGSVVKCSVNDGERDANNNCSEGCAGYENGCCEYHKVCASTCGDGTCSSDETVSSCPSDCATCGDGVCSSTEILASCPADCSTCGDGQCTGSETLSTCADDCSVCGDNQCTGNETASTCADDCVCKAMTWKKKPSGSYTPDATFSTITVTNTNSTSATTTGIALKLNGKTLSACTGVEGENCYSASTNSGGNQVVSITLFNDQTTVEEGTYVLSVTLPGAESSCVESTSFVIAAEDVVPQTGIFDGVMGKIYLGSGFVFLGVLTTQYPKFNYMFNTLGEKNRIASEKKRREEEEEKRSRFEKRFK